MIGSDSFRWMDRGVCRVEGIDVEVFFPGDRTSRVENDKRRQAKKVCMRCPVRMECLEYAIETGQTGIWGGTTEDAREKIENLRRSA